MKKSRMICKHVKRKKSKSSKENAEEDEIALGHEHTKTLNC